MKSKSFVFKQFEVAQSEGVMKITTDSILFGAWVAEQNAKQVLDIGTGSGLLAMMMAQKNTVSEVLAIDINPEAVAIAQANFANCPFSARLTVCASALQSIASTVQFDLIVSNPPYFVADLKAIIPHKLSAKHTVALSYEDLIFNIDRLLTDDGKACVVIPVFNIDYLKSLAEQRQLYVTKQVNVSAIEGKAPYLVLVQLEHAASPIKSEAIVIKNRDGSYAEKFVEMTKEFYLNF